MRMQPIYEWPELDRRTAETHAKVCTDRLAAHERGELDEPLTAEDVVRYRQQLAELNYLVHGKAANPLRLPSVNDIDWDDDYNDDLDDIESSRTPPPSERLPVTSDDDVWRNGAFLFGEGDDLWEVQEELEADLSRFSDIDSEEATEIKHRLAKVREAIAEQVRYIKAEV